MRRSHQVTANVKKVADESMHGQESLRLPGRCEPSYVPLALPCRLLGNFGAIVLGVATAGLPHVFLQAVEGAKRASPCDWSPTS